MLLEKNTIKFLKIKTGLKYFSSIFQRVYMIEIHQVDIEKKTAQVTLSSYDKTQSNKKILNTYQLLIDRKNLSIESLLENNLKFKPFMSELALLKDKSLIAETSCAYRRKSIFKITNTLRENVEVVNMMQA
jgi:hypothetical protein